MLNLKKCTYKYNNEGYMQALLYQIYCYELYNLGGTMGSIN